MTIRIPITFIFAWFVFVGIDAIGLNGLSKSLISFLALFICFYVVFRMKWFNKVIPLYVGVAFVVSLILLSIIIPIFIF